MRSATERQRRSNRSGDAASRPPPLLPASAHTVLCFTDATSNFGGDWASKTAADAASRIPVRTVMVQTVQYAEGLRQTSKVGHVSASRRALFRAAGNPACHTQKTEAKRAWRS